MSLPAAPVTLLGRLFGSLGSKELQTGTEIPRSALIELSVFFLIAAAIDELFFGGTRFMGVSPHPYWLAVSLFALQYGTSVALLTALLSAGVYLSGDLPAQRIDQDQFQYLFSLLALPMGWGMFALVIGELRRRQLVKHLATRNQLEDSRLQLETLSEAYSKLSRANERLEARIASQLKTAYTIFNAAQAVEQPKATEVLSGVETMMQEILAPEKFSLYTFAGDRLQLTFAAGWGADDAYRKDYGADSEFYQAMAQNGKVLCVNSSQDASILAGEGILAGTICHAVTGDVLAVIKVESLAFSDLNLSTIENFRLVLDWIGMAYAKAQEYEASLFNYVAGDQRQLMPPRVLPSLEMWLNGLCKRAKIDLYRLDVKTSPFGEKVGRELSTQIGEILLRFLRTTDLMFHSHESRDQFTVLLPATPAQGVEVVVQKLIKAFEEELPALESTPDIAVSVMPLNACEPKDDPLAPSSATKLMEEPVASLTLGQGIDETVAPLNANEGVDEPLTALNPREERDQPHAAGSKILSPGYFRRLLRRGRLR